MEKAPKVLPSFVQENQRHFRLHAGLGNSWELATKKPMMGGVRLTAFTSASSKSDITIVMCKLFCPQTVADSSLN
eukprot:4711918-Pyramimonas_sp.AAC.1